MHRPEREEAASLLQRTAAPPLSSIPCGNRFPGIGSTRFPGNSLKGGPQQPGFKLIAPAEAAEWPAY